MNRPPSKFKQMRNAIDAAELALGMADASRLAKLFEDSSDDIKVNIRIELRTLRLMASAYREMNRIINDPAFEKGR